MFERSVKTVFCLLLLCAFQAVPALGASPLPDGFVHVDECIPGVVLDVRYYSDDNFVGERIRGYLAPRVILSEPAARALAAVQAELTPFGLGIKVFDGYRPQQAVDHFVRWAADAKDTRMKTKYYPDVQKKHLLRDGFIAGKSGHSRGSTVDLTIIDKLTGTELDMGSSFDFFGRKSWPTDTGISPQARANRALLSNIMQRNGFKPLQREWWHFTLIDEPYPDTYFNFPVQ
ncbi:MULTISPECIES: M15 family metallopeptidase [unclassified Pseudodesulfovibrio]|uniref:M15 family metallopeptidase n=1 Tax=unclassified Pseudodesulfovibrio TaxID=2661612 RepID=UPI000FEBDB9C|nr:MULTISPECIES: M15 family metallopeptidase [unclassified Pseudodesulfovibrio]MCJ2164310.1 M15 family metallopeptidase [Pseudodesulfovibrio sp. S3-i]RWU04521.1 peptidase M15 [Pseudodesulfovibrio sp. S3]